MYVRIKLTLACATPGWIVKLNLQSGGGGGGGGGSRVPDYIELLSQCLARYTHLLCPDTLWDPLEDQS